MLEVVGPRWGVLTAEPLRSGAWPLLAGRPRAVLAAELSPPAPKPASPAGRSEEGLVTATPGSLVPAYTKHLSRVLARSAFALALVPLGHKTCPLHEDGSLLSLPWQAQHQPAWMPHLFLLHCGQTALPGSLMLCLAGQPVAGELVQRSDQPMRQSLPAGHMPLRQHVLWQGPLPLAGCLGLQLEAPCLPEASLSRGLCLVLWPGTPANLRCHSQRAG